jgi:hypothetical protein
MAGRLTWRLALAAAMVVVAGEASEAEEVAKPRARRFQPAHPLFSPYFELTRPLSTSPGRLPQYYMFYQRDLEYRARVQRQTEINKSSATAIGRLQNRVRDLSRPAPAGARFGTHRGYFGTHAGYFQLGGP